MSVPCFTSKCRIMHIQEEFLHGKGGEALEWPAQGGVPTLGGVQGRTERGTQCSELGDKVGIGHWLGSMTLEVFSNLGDSVIFCI